MRLQTRIFALFVGTLLPCLALASSFGPVLLVNTESFTVIDDGGGSSDVELRFGDTVNERLYWNVSLSQFEFTNNLNVQGTVSGSNLVIGGLPSCDSLITNSVGQIACGSIVSLTGANLATIQVRRDTDFTMLALNTFYNVPFNLTDTESLPSVLEHNSVSTERIDVKENGFYLVSYHVNANNAAVTHQLDVRVRVNNIQTLTGSLTIGRNYQNEYSPNVSTNVVFLRANDYITLQVSRATANTVINETVLTATKLNGIKGEKGEKGDPGDLTQGAADNRYVNTSGDTMTGSLTLSNNAALSVAGTLTVNADNEAANAVLTFGNDTLPETLQFNRLLSRFEFSDVLHVTDTLSTSGALIVEGDVRLKSTLTAQNVTYTFPGADGSGSGKMLATNAAGVLSWAEPVRAVTFTDATTESLTDANVDLWDGTYANISPRSTAKLVLVSVSIPYTADGNDDEYNAFTMHRAIGANPTCASTQVGEVFYGSFTTNTGGTGQAYNTFLDSPGSTGNVRYTVCSNTAATGTVSNDTQTIRFVLTEVGN